MPEAPKQSSAMPMMMRVSQRLVERSFFNSIRNTFRKWFGEDGSPKVGLSLRYGNNFIQTPQDRELLELVREDIIEIADYDPVRNSLLYIGKQAPDRFAPILWFIYRTYPDVNVVLILPENAGFEDTPQMDVDLRYINAQSSLQAMQFFKDKKAARLNSGETIFVLKNLPESENILKRI